MNITFNEYVKAQKTVRNFEEKLYWLFDEQCLNLESIRTLRAEFIKDRQWSEEKPEDGYTGKHGSIYWWSSKILHELLMNVRLGNTKEQQSLIAMQGAKANRYERELFYSSSDWVYIKYLRFCIDRGECKACFDSDISPEYHHEFPIMSSKNPGMFIRNFDINCITTLCKSCHKKFHSDKVSVVDEFEKKENL